MRRLLHLTAVSVLLIGVMTLRTASAQATLFTVNVCTGNQAEVNAYVSLTTTLRQYITNDLRALMVPSQALISALAMADMRSDNAAEMAAYGKKAKPYVTTARNVLTDQVEEHYKTMKHAVDAGAFGQDSTAKAKAAAALAQIESSIGKVRAALTQLLHAANGYATGNRAFELFTEGSTALVTAQQNLVIAGQRLGAAVGALGAGCGGAAAGVPPMSPSQVSGAAGGGGSQRATKSGFSVLAPKRIKLNQHGLTKLPLTLGQRTAAQVTITLTRGKTALRRLGGSMTGTRATSGLIVKLPRGVRRGSMRLTVTFTPSSNGAPKTISLTVRAV